MALEFDLDAYGSTDSPVTGYPFTMLCYVNVNDVLAQGNILTLQDSVESKTKFITIEGGTFTIKGTVSGTGTTSASQGFTSEVWRPVAFSCESEIKRDLILWDTIGGVPTVVTDTTSAAFPSDLDYAVIGPASGDGEDHVIIEAAIFDKALTTGQLNTWSQGVVIENANIPGNLLFYQPSLTGWNEEGSVGTMVDVGTGEFIVVPGPHLLGGNTTITNNGILNVFVQYSQIETNSSGLLDNSDIGQSTYSIIYDDGDGSGAVDKIFHTLTSGASGVTVIYDLLSLPQNILSKNVNKSMHTVKCLSIRNMSKGVGESLSIDVTGASGFSDILGQPAVAIEIQPNSCLNINDGSTLGYPIDTNNRFIDITTNKADVQYELVILGN